MKAPFMANEAFRVLNDYKMSYGDSFASTQYIARRFQNVLGVAEELPANRHQSLRKVLERLYHAGAVERWGVGPGKHKWRILVSSWNKSDPFKKVEGHVHKDLNVPYTPISHEIQPQINQAAGFEIKALAEEVENFKKANQTLTRLLNEAGEENKKLKEDIHSLKTDAQSKDQTVKTIHVKRFDGKQYKLKDKVFPKVFHRVKELAEQRRNIMLVGPSGCGKTYLAKLVADVLGLEFASLSCTAGMSEAHLLGRSVPDFTKGVNNFQGTDFLKVYETGGVGLLDELDAADPNLLLSINTGLANNYMNVPNRPDDPRAIKHRDFICIGTANTFGRGATRQYAGRNQLDEATLDRFRIGIVECTYDDVIERAVCPDEGKGFIYYSHGKETTNGTVENLIKLEYGLRGTCQYIRHKIEASGIRRVMSTRFLEDAWIMMSSADWSLKQILETFLEGWTNEEKAKIC